MRKWGWLIIPATIGYIGVCFGKIAAKHGKDPLLFGVLSVVSPINLVILGYWAFSGFESRKAIQE